MRTKDMIGRVFALLTCCLAPLSTMLAQQITFQRITSDSEKGDLMVSTEVDWPTAGPKAVVDSLRNYINENLQDWLVDDDPSATGYSGSMTDGQAMADYYANTSMRHLQSEAKTSPRPRR